MNITKIKENLILQGVIGLDIHFLDANVHKIVCIPANDKSESYVGFIKHVDRIEIIDCIDEDYVHIDIENDIANLEDDDVLFLYKINGYKMISDDFEFMFSTEGEKYFIDVNCVVARKNYRDLKRLDIRAVNVNEMNEINLL